MMTTEGHLTDAEVVGVADAQLEDAVRTRADTHLEACPTCAHRLERLRLRQERLSALLRETDFDVPAAAPPAPAVLDIATARLRREARAPSGMRATWLRIAAAIVLLVTVTLAIPPVQAAVVGWLRAQWSRITGESAVEAPAPDPQAPAGDSHIGFEHRAAEFRLELDATQPSGTILIRRVESTDVTVDADRPGVEWLVQPAGLRIMNGGATDVNYELAVPPTVTVVTVIVAGDTAAQLTSQQLIDGVRLPVR
jgi:hypothetical protein